MQGYKRQKNNFSHYQHNDNRRPRKEQEQNRPQGLVVHLREGEDINRALRKLKKKIENAGLLKELRDRQYYQKPSEKRRIAKKAGIMRWKKRQRELETNR